MQEIQPKVPNKTQFFEYFVSGSFFIFLLALSVAIIRLYPSQLLFLLLGSASFGVSFAVFMRLTKKERILEKVNMIEFPPQWRAILNKEVVFYRKLDEPLKQIFEKKLQYFLLTKRIIGVKTEITELDKLLIASAATIPVLNVNNWDYDMLTDILVYPKAIDLNFQFEHDNGTILGMVGTGNMNYKMALSQQALRQGFRNARDGKNVAIHEFVHLIDKADGSVDGIPRELMENQYVLPWIDLLKKEVRAILESKSDIDFYATTDEAEFLAVVSEYFFENPDRLKKKHPELYDLMNEIFNQDISMLYQMGPNSTKIRRNDPCPCNSGRKFKHCCGAEFYSLQLKPTSLE